MAEHSMCQPGRPRPHGDSHEVSSPSLCAFPEREVAGIFLQVARFLLLGGLLIASASIRPERAP